MTEHEMAEMDAWLEALVRADDAFDAHITEIAEDDVPMSVLIFAPFAPHIDKVPAHAALCGIEGRCAACELIEQDQREREHAHG